VDGLDGERVKGGVEERRMQGETARLPGGSFGQVDLGEELVAALPDSTQPLEVRAVAEPCAGESVVESVERERDGAGRRPDPQVEGG
jgi:hypothetical protein